MQRLGILIFVAGLWAHANVHVDRTGEGSEWRYMAAIASIMGALLYLEGFKQDLVERIKSPAGRDRPRAPILPPRGDER